MIYEPPVNGLRFQFDTKPSNSYVDIVYFQTLSSTTSHVYQVTNDIWQDNYWDTRYLPEDDYVVMVFTEDTRQNTDTAYVPVSVVASDTSAPAQPRFKYVKGSDTDIYLGWFPNSEPDLMGYRMYFSFDNTNWTLFKDENIFTAAITDTVLHQVLNSDIYFRLTAVDNAPVPNESIPSDVYGMSNGTTFLGKVLIVNGFDRTDGGWTLPNHDFVFTHSTAIDANQFSFDSAPNESVEDSLISLNDYAAVFWILGDESTVNETFSAAEQALVKDYLENGGKLFVSGSQVAWDLDPDGAGNATPEDEQFLHEYLKADFVTNHPGILQVSGADSSIFQGLNFGFGQIPYQVDSSDVVTPVGAGAKACLKYDTSKVAAVQYAGTFGAGTSPGKIVYCTFPFETITEAQTRTIVMERVLEYFFDITSVKEGGENAGIPSQFALSPSYPNPFNPTTTFEYHLPVTSKVTVEIFNSLGQKIRTMVNHRQAAGRYQMSWEGRNDHQQVVANGVYFVGFRAQAENSPRSFRQVRKVVFLK